MAAAQDAQAAGKHSSAAAAETTIAGVKTVTWNWLQHRMGRSWPLIGLATYSLLSWMAYSVFYDPAVNAAWQDTVPVAMYDRSVFVFGTALLVDVLNALFEAKTTKLDFVLLPAFIKGVVVLTNLVILGRHTPIVQTSTGSFVMLQRYICWLHTTPTMLVLVALISSSVTRRQTARALAWNACMLVCGVVADLVTGPLSVILAIVAHVAMIPVLIFMHKGLSEACQVMATSAPRYTGTMAYYMIMLMWITFGLVWDLRRLGAIDAVQEDVLYLSCDFMAKVLFSNSLMLGCFNGLEARRQEVMRQIEEGNKQTLIDELKKVLDQKSNFMSAVSHELRTPLNGIIGISESMLSGCCGTLPRSVRRQVYIIRTSGARLLALINDVMDAAALQQQRLILKQERVPLRSLVDDMLDLTHSLVDPDVELRNCVPEEFVVWGDSGRIVQILNNLLGNACKFTARGHITVGAGWRDESRKEVAVYVLDSGIGIPKQKLSTIFLPFEQVDSSISRRYGGFGLGLSIVQELVRAHGGDITVRSQVNSGSCFTFTLPSYTNQQVTSTAPEKRAAARALAQGTAGDTHSAPATATPAGAHDTPAAAPQGGGLDFSELPPSPRQETALKSVRRTLSRHRLLGPVAPASSSASNGHVLSGHEEIQYDAVELAVLASSKPYDRHSSRRASVQFAGPEMVGKPDVLAAGNGGAHDTATLQLRQAFSTAAAVFDSDDNGDTTAGSAASGSGPSAGGSSSSLGSPRGGAAARDGPLGASLSCKPTWSVQHGKVQILSVDDDNINRAVVESLLDSTGYVVVSARNGREALAHLASCKAMPDLVLLDVMMPDLSGLEVCAIIRSTYPDQPLPILMVSAASEETSVVKGLDAGADGYITKPFRRQELLARIAALLSAVKEEKAPSALLPKLESNVGTAPAAGSAKVEGGGTFVLCVDDDETHMRVLQGILESQNMRVATATSRAEALELFAPGATPPDMVLLDTSLHDTSGVKLLAELRQAYTPLQLPIIIITSRPSEASIVQALEAGANDVLAKPFRRSELMARLRMHLRRSTPHRNHALQQQQQLVVQGISSVASSTSRSLEGAPGVVLPQSSRGGLLKGLVDMARNGNSGMIGTPDEEVARTGPVVEVPVLVAVVEGLEGLLPHQALWQFVAGRLVDAFDTELEKYAVHKVEMTETVLVVAAPPRVNGSSNDLQPSPQLPHADGPTNEWGLSAVHDHHETGSRAAVTCGTSRDHHQGPFLDLPLGIGVTAVALLMQLGSELLTDFNKTLEAAMAHFSSPMSSSPASASSAQPALTPEIAQALLSDIKMHVAIHEGELTTAVVGRVRPRFKYYGAAVQGAQEACSAFQVTGLVATPRVGRQLEEAGFKGLMPISAHKPAGSRSSADHASAFVKDGGLDRLYLIDWQRLDEGWGTTNPYAQAKDRPGGLDPAVWLVAGADTPGPDAAGAAQLAACRHPVAAATATVGSGTYMEEPPVMLQDDLPASTVVCSTAAGHAAGSAAASHQQGPRLVVQAPHSFTLEADAQHDQPVSLQQQLVRIQQQLTALAQQAPAGSMALGPSDNIHLSGPHQESSADVVGHNTSVTRGSSARDTSKGGVMGRMMTALWWATDLAVTRAGTLAA